MKHLSPFQFVQQPDGTMGLKDNPSVTLHTVEGQGSAVCRDWAKEIGLPTYYEEWEALARIKSDKPRGRLTFILFDESETNLVGHPRLIPQHIALPTRCPIEIAHEGFLVGEVFAYFLNDPNGLTLPALEGNYVLASAYLYDSDLSVKVMEAMKRGILTHACPNIWSPPGSPTGTGLLVQVSLVPNDLPGCPNAKVLSWSE